MGSKPTIACRSVRRSWYSSGDHKHSTPTSCLNRGSSTAEGRTSRGETQKSAGRKSPRRRTQVAPPEYSAEAVGRIARRVEVQGIELIGMHFSRADSSAVPGSHAAANRVPEIGIRVDWDLSEERSTLGCVLTFGLIFQEQAPYELVGQFRLSYAISGDGALDQDDLNNFAHWNAMFNAWPYWRELVSSTLSRAQLPHFLVPVMGVPRARTTS